MLHRPPTDEPSGWRITAYLLAAWLAFVLLGAVAGLILSAVINR